MRMIRTRAALDAGVVASVTSLRRRMRGIAHDKDRNVGDDDGIKSRAYRGSAPTEEAEAEDAEEEEEGDADPAPVGGDDGPDDTACRIPTRTYTTGSPFSSARSMAAFVFPVPDACDTTTILRPSTAVEVGTRDL
jgi:hypothetical protein